MYRGKKENDKKIIFFIDVYPWSLRRFFLPGICCVPAETRVLDFGEKSAQGIIQPFTKAQRTDPKKASN